MTVSYLFTRDVVDKGPSRGYEIIVIGTIFTFLATCGMIARFASVRMLKGSFGIAEGLILVSFLFNVFGFGLFAWGLGRHAYTLTMLEATRVLKVAVITTFVQPTVLTTAKMSTLVLLYKIFVTRSSRIVIVIFMAVVMAWYIALILGATLICRPFHDNWSITKAANCGNKGLGGIIAPIPWIITDFGILILPMPMIRRLQMPKRQKIALGAMFLFGGLTCIVSCIRYAFVFLTTSDDTWSSVPLVMMQLVESNTTILCACFIGSRPVIMYLIPDRLISRIRSSVTSMRRHSIDKLTPQSTQETSAPSISEKMPHNVIRKSSSVRLESVPRDTSSRTDVTDGSTQYYLQVVERSYSCTVEGGMGDLEEGLSIHENPSMSDTSTLRDV